MAEGESAILPASASAVARLSSCNRLRSAMSKRSSFLFMPFGRPSAPVIGINEAVRSRKKRGGRAIFAAVNDFSWGGKMLSFRTAFAALLLAGTGAALAQNGPAPGPAPAPAAGAPQPPPDIGVTRDEVR